MIGCLQCSHTIQDRKTSCPTWNFMLVNSERLESIGNYSLCGLKAQITVEIPCKYCATVSPLLGITRGTFRLHPNSG